MLAKKAVEAGLSVEPYVKTSLSPGSGVVKYYLNESGVMGPLSKLGFDIVGYGCMTCIGNSGPLDDSVAEAIEKVYIYIYAHLISYTTEIEFNQIVSQKFKNYGLPRQRISGIF